MEQFTHYGPGIWSRLQHRFRTRLTEWMLAIIMTLWGAIVLLPGDTFSQPSFSGFKALFGREEIIASVMVIVGLIRLAGLIINGARKNVTPHIRMTSAAIGFVIWSGIIYCYASSGILSTWAAVYPIFAVVELVNVYLAGRDVGESHGRTG